MADLQAIANWFKSKIPNDPRFNSVSPIKDTSLLYPPFYSLLQQSLTEFENSHSYKTTVIETYRSNALQLKYYNQGASQIKSDGMHHYGIAADIAFIINGKVSYNGDYTKLRNIFTKNGLTIIGDWDKGHVQYIPVNQQQQLRDLVASTSIVNVPKGQAAKGGTPSPGVLTAGISPLAIILLIGFAIAIIFKSK